MPSPPNLTNITPPRVPLTDERTGLISREWYRFFLNLFNLTGGGSNVTSLTDLQVGPPAPQQEDLTGIVVDVEAAKTQPTQESAIEQIAELAKQVEALSVLPLTSWVLSELAELQTQIDGLSATAIPPVSFLTNGSSILYGDNLGGFSNVTIGSGVSFSGGTLSATGSGGTVTSVGATAPITSTGGTTPVIGVTAAALTRVNDTNVTLTLGGSPNTALLAATSLTLGWTGQLATSRGGTGLSSYTANGVVYASSTSALATGSALTFDGTNFATTGSATATALIPSGSATPTNGMYLPAANTVAFSTASTDRLRIGSDGRLQINGASAATATLVGTSNAFPLNVAATAYQFRADATFDAANTSAVGFGSTYGFPSSGTFTSSYQFFAGNILALTGTAAVTNNYGFFCNSQTVGTNIYGFYSNIAAASARWNFFANGTANNAYAGNSRFGGVTAPTVAVDVTGAVLATGNVTGGYNNPAAGTTAMAFGSYNVVRVTPNANATYTTTVPAAGTRLTLIILTSGVTPYTITFGTGFKTTGTLVTGVTSARYFMVSFVSDGTNVLETARTIAIA